MKSEPDSGRDPETGLPDREHFLETVRDFRRTAIDTPVVGCLLVLELPSLEGLRKRCGYEPVDAVLRDVLALVESRLRSRDSLGRLGSDTLCILLRQCPVNEAEQVSSSFADALAGFKLKHNGRSEPFVVQRRVIQLESLETLASRRPVPVKVEPGVFVPGLSSARSPMPATATVHRFTAACRESKAARETSGESVVDEAVVPAPEFDESADAAPWRAEPAIRLGEPRSLAAFRLRSMQPQGLRRDRDGFQKAIMTLAASRTAKPRSPLPLLIVDMSHKSLNDASVQWVLDVCAQHRIGAESICVALNHRGWSGRLREAMPPLKRLDRAGIGVMLDALELDRHGEIIERLVRIDFRQLTAGDRSVAESDAVGTDRLRRRIRNARDAGSKVLARGVDQEAQIGRLRYLGVDIGFGQLAGKSVPLNSLIDL